MGTVGLSMGLTSELSLIGKLSVIMLMTAGRFEILNFGLALASNQDSGDECEENDLII